MNPITFNYTGAIQSYVVPMDGTYQLSASGAGGGAGLIDGNPAGTGGSGAIITATFDLRAGQQLQLVVGGIGGSASSANISGGAGGGGFTAIFVNSGINGTYVPLLIAGGGGGGGGRTIATGGNAPLYTIGNSLGSGGAGGDSSGGGGGAGALSSGGDADVNFLYARGGATGPTYAGGIGVANPNGNGGFGGGGGGGFGGGGGAGAVGGNGGNGTFPTTGGGGGTSYVSSDGTLIAAGAGDGVSTGNGSASIALVCYAAGTRICTVVGEIAVENLRVGDLAVTASGEARPVRWIGHRTVACQGRKDVLPMRIAADAFGPGRPVRDLTVSPAHALCLPAEGGEVLIPACRLINGTTITQVEVESVTYWHVELDSHDILLAEGLPAESYLDCGNRSFFANAPVTGLRAVPDARPDGPLPFCRPFHEAGPVVETVRARLEARAKALGWTLVQEPPAGLHLVADGRVIEPDVAGLTARFVLPADARDVCLVSETSVPADVLPGSTDDRRLGVALAALTIDDGLTGAKEIALDDSRLGDGFHAVEGGMRWTDGGAVLPASLWTGCRGTVFLRVALARPALPRWVGPGEAADGAEVRRRA